MFNVSRDAIYTNVHNDGEHSCYVDLSGYAAETVHAHVSDVLRCALSCSGRTYLTCIPQAVCGTISLPNVHWHLVSMHVPCFTLYPAMITNAAWVLADQTAAPASSKLAAAS